LFKLALQKSNHGYCNVQEKRGRSKSEEKRQQIILSAGMLFVEHGFEKVSMEGIAKTAGVSKQTYTATLATSSSYLLPQSSPNVMNTNSSPKSKAARWAARLISIISAATSPRC
jgi:hypothetical protein